MIRERIIDLVKTELMLDDLDLDADFINEHDLDSISLLDFIMTLEEEFDIEIPDEELSELKSVNDIINLVESKTGN